MGASFKMLLPIREVNSKNLTEAESEKLHGAMLFDPPYCDDAIVGICMNENGQHIAMYDVNEMIDLTAANDEMSIEDARDHVEHNLAGSLPSSVETDAAYPVLLCKEDPLFPVDEDFAASTQTLELGGEKYYLVAGNQAHKAFLLESKNRPEKQTPRTSGRK